MKAGPNFQPEFHCAGCNENEVLEIVHCGGYSVPCLTLNATCNFGWPRTYIA